MIKNIMFEIKRGVLEDVLGKIYTVLIDRRFWVSLLTVIGLVFGLPELAENSEQAGTDVVDAITLIAQSVGSLIATITLILSWTKRPPSGKEHNEIMRLAAYLNSKHGIDIYDV